MAEDPHSPGDPLYESLSCSASGLSLYARTFFPKARNFTIAGGSFTNVVNCAPTVLSDFRTIPLGDVDLRNEIRLEDGVVTRQRGLCAARRVYTARIEGKPSDMTVSVYQGENAEEELAKYAGLRFGAAGIICG
ncbi:hypothetical protein C8R44DRAFT_863128 [Mycena epipterygia]|nr:hypothetical protein C8R44DRAFT_863128 [Mycena epipterygia]